MKLTATTEVAAVAAGQRCTLRVKVAALAPEVAGNNTPLNLAVVVDRSGSMGGPRIASVRRATEALYTMLSPNDVFSLVSYDNEVDTLVYPDLVSNQRGVQQIIAQLRTGGSTALAAGYERGATLAGDFQGDDRLTRIMLLSDGQANAGETRPHKLAEMANRFAADGVQTTAIGIGDDYNEELMGALADAGGGSAHVIETPDDATSVFVEELGYLKSTVASQLRLQWEPARSVLDMNLLNNYRETREGWQLGNVYSAQEKAAVLELSLDALPEGEHDLGRFVLCWRNAEGVEHRVTTMLLVNAVPAIDAANAERNEDVLEAWAFVALANATGEAIRHADAGDFDQAASAIQAMADAIDALGLTSDRMRREVRDARERIERLTRERERYYTRMSRKRMFHENSKAAAFSVAEFDAMKSRRRSEDLPWEN